MGDWQNKNFNDYIAVVDSGISMLENEANKAPAEDKEQWLARIHAMNYNLTADLADCWPGDEQARTNEHFARELKAAEHCIKLQEKLGMKAGILSMDYWVKGMHELSMGKVNDAVESWHVSFEYAKKDAEENNKSSIVSKDAPFSVILGLGYLGLARWIKGDEAGKAEYEQAVNTFKAQTDDASLKGDAEFGISQLEKVKHKYLKQ